MGCQGQGARSNHLSFLFYRTDRQNFLLQSQEKSEFYANKFEEANMVIQGILISVGKVVDLFKTIHSPFTEESAQPSQETESNLQNLIGTSQNIIVTEDNAKQILGTIQSDSNDVVTLNQIFSYGKKAGANTSNASGEEQVDVSTPAKVTMPLPGSIVKLIANNPLPALNKLAISAPTTKYALLTLLLDN